MLSAFDENSGFCNDVKLVHMYVCIYVARHACTEPNSNRQTDKSQKGYF